ncbi:hypothetical protein DFA_07889 [Cavenderia fasciculata]|uniref:Uncharacterized protein n=1 Tax=Cavenderia fasciculata TaxID=261658 RepID=F4Q3Z4_CACFS|nr:uncharacterized protein DFA_07889 [Cavenderia fasciculata]EGG16908.1 hypothetical protein DFA_07889 [Cavenderia fasciculata]|eukprot:XP_004355382.1 hypothetical protein DFA_07889 [Cavenderia fasciculata]
MHRNSEATVANIGCGGASTTSSSLMMPPLCRFDIREYDSVLDERAESKIPRLQFSYNSDGPVDSSQPVQALQDDGHMRQGEKARGRGRRRLRLQHQANVGQQMRPVCIDYLFVGYDVKDPLAEVYKLKKGIKNLEFTATVGALSSADKEMAVRSASSSSSATTDSSSSESIMWNDPRDYGILMLYSDQDDCKTIVPPLSIARSPKLEQAIRSPRTLSPHQSPKVKSVSPRLNLNINLSSSTSPGLSPRNLLPGPSTHHISALALNALSPRGLATVHNQALSPRTALTAVY